MNLSEKNAKRFMRAAGRVRRRRLELGETAEELARRAGIPARSVRAVEAGEPGALRMDEIFNLCAALGLRPADLFGP